MADKDRAGQRKRQGVSWAVQLFGAAANALKPVLEKHSEELLDRALENPHIRGLFDWNPGLSSAILSALIGALPEGDKDSVRGNILHLLVDLGESVPREIGRVLEGKEPKGKGSSGKTIFHVFHEKIAPRAGELAQWFGGLTPEEQKFAEHHLTILKPEQLTGFLALSRDEKNIILKYRVAQETPPPRPQPERTGPSLWDKVMAAWKESQRRRDLR